MIAFLLLAPAISDVHIVNTACAHPRGICEGNHHDRQTCDADMQSEAADNTGGCGVSELAVRQRRVMARCSVEDAAYLRMPTADLESHQQARYAMSPERVAQQRVHNQASQQQHRAVVLGGSVPLDT